MFKGLFLTKSFSSLIKDSGAEDIQHGLKRTLGPVNLVSFGVGGIIGAGIFVMTGQAAAQYAGAGIIYSYIFSAIACVFSGLCFAEFSAMMPIAGSTYSYTYATMGEFLAWLIGWDMVLEYLFCAPTVAVGWSGYIVSFLHDFGYNVPAVLANAPLDYVTDAGWKFTGAIVNLPAVLVTFAMTVLLTVGIEESAWFNNLIVVVKVTVILLFIIFGISHIHMENLHPFVPANTGVFGQFGWSGVLRGAGVIFFAYIGFDAVTTVAQESKNPQRDVPIGIIGSILICAILYVLVALVLTGSVHYSLLNVPDPIAVGVNAAGPGYMWLRFIVKAGAIAGLSSVVLLLLLGQTRIFFSMAKDGMLPKLFSAVHPRFRTPHWGTIIVGVSAMVLAGLFPLSILGELVSMGTLLALVIVCIAVLILRYTHPDAHRPFRTPFVHVIAILGILTALAQMVSLPYDTWFRFAIWMTIGVVIYFAYSYKHSKLRT